MSSPAYDSTADTLRHSLRVGELMSQPITELVQRSVQHDISKTEPPEVETFNEFTPKLRNCTYGSDEYKGYLAAMSLGLAHHYAHNRHHPEHFPNGISGMTLVDLIEMLADWKAATERHADGSLTKSLPIQAQRFGISDQLAEILRNTARHFRWLDGEPPAAQYTKEYDELQAVHVQRQADDPDHDRCSCVCCCWDCPELLDGGVIPRPPAAAPTHREPRRRSQ